MLIRDLSIELATNVNNLADVWGSLDHSDHMEPAGRRFAVYQDSSGGSNWQHVNHVNRDGRVPATFRGFRAMRDERLIEGLRATPIASIGGGASRISVALPRFWQMFPKSIEADSRPLRRRHVPARLRRCARAAGRRAQHARLRDVLRPRHRLGRAARLGAVAAVRVGGSAVVSPGRRVGAARGRLAAVGGRLRSAGQHGDQRRRHASNSGAS